MTQITLIKAPATKIVDGNGIEFGETLTLIPPTSLQQVASLIKKGSPDSNIKFVDMCVESPKREEGYGTFRLEHSSFEKIRVGTPFRSIDDDVARSDIVGLSNNHTFQANVYRNLIEHIKGVNPNTTIVIGGNDISFRPNFYLDSGADIIVYKRGDSSVPLLFKALSQGTQIEHVPGIIFRNSSGDIVRTRYKQPTLTELPQPDLSISERYDELYKQIPEGNLPKLQGKMGFVQTVLGCDLPCYFCTVPRMSGKFQQSSLEQTLGLINHYHRNGVRTNLTIDDNFLLKTRTEEGRQNLVAQYGHMRELGWMWFFYDGFQISLLSQDGKVDEGLIGTLFSHQNGKDDSYVGCAGAYCPIESLTDERGQLKKLTDEASELEILSAVASHQPYRLDLGNILTPSAFKNISLVRNQLTKYIKTLREASNYQTSVQVMPFCLEPLPGTRPFREYKGPFDVNVDPEAWNGYIDVMEGSLRNTIQRQKLQEELNNLGRNYNG